jgi:hypothetical protein
VPHKSVMTVFTKTVDVVVAERDFGGEGSTEIDLNHGQASLELMEDGRILFSAYEGSANCTPMVEFESLEDFIDGILSIGKRV